MTRLEPLRRSVPTPPDDLKGHLPPTGVTHSFLLSKGPDTLTLPTDTEVGPGVLGVTGGDGGLPDLNEFSRISSRYGMGRTGKTRRTGEEDPGRSRRPLSLLGPPPLDTKPKAGSSPLQRWKFPGEGDGGGIVEFVTNPDGPDHLDPVAGDPRRVSFGPVLFSPTRDDWPSPVS